MDSHPLRLHPHPTCLPLRSQLHISYTSTRTTNTHPTLLLSVSTPLNSSLPTTARLHPLSIRPRSYGATLEVMRVAERARLIHNKPTSSQDDSSLRMSQLVAENARLASHVRESQGQSQEQRRGQGQPQQPQQSQQLQSLEHPLSGGGGGGGGGEPERAHGVRGGYGTAGSGHTEGGHAGGDHASFTPHGSHGPPHGSLGGGGGGGHPNVMIHRTGSIEIDYGEGGGDTGWGGQPPMMASPALSAVPTTPHTLHHHSTHPGGPAPPPEYTQHLETLGQKQRETEALFEEERRRRVELEGKLGDTLRVTQKEMQAQMMQMQVRFNGVNHTIGIEYSCSVKTRDSHLNAFVDMTLFP